ncbi:MAG: isoleucine--tRNA ligase [Chloroflexi bacterium]|nr:isoleucine--tRNA ligase [Chloroflexota bacterium]
MVLSSGDEESMFSPVESKVNHSELEERILRFWRERSIFQKTLDLRRGGEQFTLYDGPPTINGNPGIHHVLSRVYKDVIPRYKTMNGYRVFRKAGWDTHGLPVELEVEKKLGFTNKAQIEEFGIAQFNSRCRQSVLGYLGKWQELTERIGFWLDMEHPYVTFENSYVESLWWIIKQLWDKGLVYQDFRVTPHCPRCSTSLSSHEVALGYRDAEDPSVYVRFRTGDDIADWQPRLRDKIGHLIEGLRPSLLAWTTTPWTLTGNVALAVAPDRPYVLVKTESPGSGVFEGLIMARALLDQALGPGNREILAEFPGEYLDGVGYERLYDPKPETVASGRKLDLLNHVVTAAFVSMEDGTGIVHIAPAFGDEDFDLGRRRNLPMVQSVDLDGRMIPNGKPWDGRFVKEADHMILDDLKQRNLLHRAAKVTHTYPFCWRCSTPLLYYAKPSWYIRTTAVREALISGNQKINWYPEYIKYGRFGDWLENNVDWAFSRERFWGTPLPIWRCDRTRGHDACVGSIKELASQDDVEGLQEPLDLHRPFVDQVTFRCSKCGGTMRRVPEVLDAWFDSGAMPVAQFHVPFEMSVAEFQKKYWPADYICEAIDQTRGWFYTLHALSTLLFEEPCFKNVICLGHVLDAKGEKMSKAKGNVVDPWKMIEKHGADALRWYMFTSTPAGNVKRFDASQVAEAQRKFLSTLWNTYSFFVLYSNIDRFDPTKAQKPPCCSDLDRWILSELNELIGEVTEALDGYNPTDAGRRIEEFVERLSNWYVRRSRRRFWKSESDADKLSAYFTLYECLVALSKLLAPLTPFMTEEMYQNLVRSVDSAAEESVHLCQFPKKDLTQIDEALAADTRLAMKVSSLGRAARSGAGIKVRQPLAKVLVKTKSRSEAEGLARLASQVLEELNVKEIEFVAAETDLVDRPGCAVATEGDYSVGLVTDVSSDLVEEGLAREVVRRLQTMRRSAGFDIADHIATSYQADLPLQQAIEHLSSYIQGETLSRVLVCRNPEEDDYTESCRIHGYSITLGVRRVGMA